MQEVGGSIPPGSTTLHYRRIAPPAKAIAPGRFDFIEAALRGDRSRKIGNQSKTEHRNPLMFSSSNAGASQARVRFFLQSSDNMCGGGRRRPCYAGRGFSREPQMGKFRIGARLFAGFAMMLADPLSAQQRQQAPNSNLNAE